MRLPYTPDPPTFTSPTDNTILNNITTRRGPSGLVPLDPKIREVVFCRVAALLRCGYEWDIHAPLAREAGVTEGELEELKRMEGWGDIIAGGD